MSPSADDTSLVEFQPRKPRIAAAWLSISQVAEEVDFDISAGEELPRRGAGIEPAHGPAIQPQRAGGHDEVAALQAAVAQRGLPGAGRAGIEPGYGVGLVGVKPGQVLVKAQVKTHHRSHW